MNRSTYPVNGRAPSADLLAAALDYHRRGWSVIPTAPRDKKAAVKWERYQSHRATDGQLEKWFGDGAGYGIAVVFGDVSGGLVDREWDNLAAYHEWADRRPDLAQSLPTFASARGRHVLCRATPGGVDTIRAALGKSDGKGAIPLGDGELRCGVGCYSVFPPSIHPSGKAYRWVVPLGNGDLPILDLMEVFFGKTTWNMSAQLAVSDVSAQSAVSAVSAVPAQLAQLAVSAVCTPSFCVSSSAAGKKGDEPSFESVEAAIRNSLPSPERKRNLRVFDLARELKAIPALADAPANSADLKRIVRMWHKRVLPLVATKPWEETWFDFMRAWRRVKFPAGQGPIKRAFDRAKAAAPPEAAAQFETPALRQLVAFCRELQRTAGDEAFFLACRTASALLGVTYKTASRWLEGLCNDGILRCEETGTFANRRASRYRYVAREGKAQ